MGEVFLQPWWRSCRRVVCSCIVNSWRVYRGLFQKRKFSHAASQGYQHTSTIFCSHAVSFSVNLALQRAMADTPAGGLAMSTAFCAVFSIPPVHIDFERHAGQLKYVGRHSRRPKVPLTSATTVNGMPTACLTSLSPPSLFMIESATRCLFPMTHPASGQVYSVTVLLRSVAKGFSNMVDVAMF